MPDQIGHYGQIQFPATQVPSANANNLDDYEEGPWTPALSFGGGTTDIAYHATLNGGRYVKIGSQVTLTGIIYLANKGSSNGDALITGLPFANGAGNANYCSPSLELSNISFANQYKARIAPSAQTIALMEVTEAGAATTLTDANFANDSWIAISATYFV